MPALATYSLTGDPYIDGILGDAKWAVSSFTFSTPGSASYYGKRFAGRPTASAERFNPQNHTAAHRTLPLGSKLRVTNVRNGRSVVVEVNA